jgi:hypothetical protein
MSCPHGLVPLNALVPCRTSGCAAGWGKGGVWVYESISPGFMIANWPSSPTKAINIAVYGETVGDDAEIFVHEEVGSNTF